MSAHTSAASTLCMPCCNPAVFTHPQLLNRIFQACHDAMTFMSVCVVCRQQASVSPRFTVRNV